jgi:hypothetical protein
MLHHDLTSKVRFRQGEKPAAASNPQQPSSVSDFARSKLGFEPDALQAAVLDSQAKRGVLNCTRQWGKSTVLAVKAVHRAYTAAGSLTLVAAPSNRQSGEFLRKAAAFLAPLGVKRRGDGDNPCSLSLPNGSRIVGVPGTEGTVRGFSAVSLLLIDEASRVSDEMYKSLRPMLAVGEGDLWLMSTPFGKRGFFHEACTRGDEWDRHSVPATACPRISPAFLEGERSSMGDDWFAQEYLCEFVDAGGGWFRSSVIEGALTGGEPLWKWS